MKPLIGKLFGGIDQVGLWGGLLCLRAILGWEFFESGLEKFRGENWFADIQEKFPFPFSVVPPEISWQMATWFELLGGIALAIGLGTRFFGAVSVMPRSAKLYAPFGLRRIKPRPWN